MKSLGNAINDEQRRQIGTGIVELVEQYGIGLLSKADLEATLYSLIRQNIDRSAVKDSRDWIRLLRVTPAKLRSMQLIESVRKRPISLQDKSQWAELAASLENTKIELEDKDNGLVRFHLDDAHIRRFVEEFVVDNGSSVDYKLNANQVVLKYPMFETMLKAMQDITGASQDDTQRELSNDTAHRQIENEINSPAAIWKEIKSKIKDKAVDQAISTLFSHITSAAFKAVRKKVFGAG